MLRHRRSLRRAIARHPRQTRPGIEACEARLVLSAVVHIAQNQAASVAVPVVSMDQTTGESVVAWDGPNSDVYFRTVPRGGNPAPPVDSGTDVSNNGTSGTTSVVLGVSMNDNGDFVVAYADHNSNNINLNGEWFQRFNASGSPVGQPKFAGFINIQDHKFSGVAMDNSDDVVIVQTGLPITNPQGGRSTRIDAEEFTASNSTAGGFNVTMTAGQNGQASVSMDQASGSFVIGYSTPGSNNSIIADVFASFATSGNTFVAGSDFGTSDPSVAMNNNGEVAVSWLDVNSSSNETVKVGLFSSNGSSISGGGVAFTPPSGYTIYSTSISLNDSGAFATSWTYSANATTFSFGVSLNLGTPT
jgi:hypothetical protein